MAPKDSAQTAEVNLGSTTAEATREPGTSVAADAENEADAGISTEKDSASLVTEAKDMKTKMLERAKRFGLSVPETEVAKKVDRAKRFGLSNPELEPEKKKEATTESKAGLDAATIENKKAERERRFGSGSTESVAVGSAEAGLDAAKIEDELKKKRAARFGSSHPDLEKDKKRQRLERFGTTTCSDEETKKQLRATRFGPVAAAA
eukprot:TRINITY_DN372_c0_g2_i1.p1 TRINITY_DN372_c0_g2~~TRINITY_DN372_c0_g2_i1.p1  ORF type:complete len:232 (-),score=57.18 TRINITY_DN372_c0_g2_i1:203-820(-)